MANLNNPLSRENYKFIFEKIPRLCVDLIIKSADGLLLSLRDIEPNKGVWHFPGGMVHKNESIRDATKRIAQKETGLIIKMKDCLGYMEFPNEQMNDFVRHSVSIAISATVVGGQLKNDFQSKELKYFKTLPEKIYPGQEIYIKNNLP